MRIGILTIIMVSVAILTGCSGTRDVAVQKADASPEAQEIHTAMIPNPSNALPKAVVYRTNGDYNNNVMVTVDPSSGRITSYPAPCDVSSASSAMPLGDGWLLDRRGGIGTNSAFLDYTYDEYSALNSVPSAAVLKEHIIPGAFVTEYMVLPVTVSDAMADPSSLKKYLK